MRNRKLGEANLADNGKFRQLLIITDTHINEFNL